MQHVKRIQVLLSPAQLATFRELAEKLYPPRKRNGVPAANDSIAGRQAILEWIRNHAGDVPRE